MNELVYEFLSGEDKQRVIPLFEQSGLEMPRLEFSGFAVVENETGEIVAAMTLQLVAHAEPVLVKREYAGQIDFSKLREIIEEVARAMGQQAVLIVADTPAKARMAERAGFQPLLGPLHCIDLR